MSLSQSAQMFWPGGSWGVAGAGLVSGATTCLSPATPVDAGADTTPEFVVSGATMI